MNLVDRVKRVLLSPRTEWEAIDHEPTTPAQLFTGYAMPLAAIGPVALVLGYSIIGFSGPLRGTFRTPIGATIAHALLLFVLDLVGTYLLALVISGLAPTFAGRRDQLQAFKVAVYANTAVWVAGIFYLIPMLRRLPVLLGLYSLYLLYLGLTILMKPPQEKTVAYFAAVMVAALVLLVITRNLAAHFMLAPTAPWTVP